VNIFITKSILINIEANKCFFKTFAKLKNTKSLKNVSRNYYHSINLLALINDESTLAYDCNLTLSFIQYNIHFNFKSDLDLFFYTESDCERRFLLKAQFREFKICDNLSDLIQEEEFVKNFESDILWGIFSLSSLFLFFFVIFLCTIHYNIENTRLQSKLVSTFLPTIKVIALSELKISQENSSPLNSISLDPCSNKIIETESLGSKVISNNQVSFNRSSQQFTNSQKNELTNNSTISLQSVISSKNLEISKYPPNMPLNLDSVHNTCKITTQTKWQKVRSMKSQSTDSHL